MSLMGMDLDRLGDPVREVSKAITTLAVAYRERTQAVTKQADALSRIADIMEGKVLVS
jgi:hypothetical protein